MAVNQSQVDHIITAASEDDPEVKLQNLEREVDLIKTSIKRLLMDIRERMNELENPFTLAVSASGGSAGDAAADNANEAKIAALEAKAAALDARESTMDAADAAMVKEKESKKAEPEPKPETHPSAPHEERRVPDEQMIALLKTQMPANGHKAGQNTLVNEKLRLQKVYKLFKWTNGAIRKFGHDRLDIILESYRIMGYITRESCDEIKEISRLMPANLGDEHEVGPDEFVSELYALNRILSPTDSSLDRDMIEVMMEQRQQMLPAERPDVPELSVKERESSRNVRKDEEWMNLPDRI
jgi:hypothetical protein